MTPSWAPNLSWILPDLAVGGSFPHGLAPRLVGDHGVGAVVDLREESRDDPEELSRCGVRFLHLPTADMMAVSQAMLDEGVGFAEAARRDGLRLLIHCEHGIGRSALLALCILVRRGMAPLEALRVAKDGRFAISPSEAQFRAWARWIGRRSEAMVPSYESFCLIAYRDLPGQV